MYSVSVCGWGEKQNLSGEGNGQNFKWKPKNFEFNRQDHKESEKRDEAQDGVGEEDAY